MTNNQTIKLITDFFEALSACFCENFPETVDIYKFLLVGDDDKEKDIIKYFEEYLKNNLDNIKTKNILLEPIKFSNCKHVLNIHAIFTSRIGKANSEIIWEYLTKICINLELLDEQALVSAEKSSNEHLNSEDFIGSLVSQVATKLGPIDEGESISDIFKRLINNGVMTDIIESIESHVQNNKNSANDLMSVAGSLMSKVNIPQPPNFQ